MRKISQGKVSESLKVMLRVWYFPHESQAVSKIVTRKTIYLNPPLRICLWHEEWINHPINNFIDILLCAHSYDKDYNFNMNKIETEVILC